MLLLMLLRQEAAWAGVRVKLQSLDFEPPGGGRFLEMRSGFPLL